MGHYSNCSYRKRHPSLKHFCAFVCPPCFALKNPCLNELNKECSSIQQRTSEINKLGQNTCSTTDLREFRGFRKLREGFLLVVSTKKVCSSVNFTKPKHVLIYKPKSVKMMPWFYVISWIARHKTLSRKTILRKVPT